MQFFNRQQAGAELAKKLAMYRNAKNAIVIALPRGGMPVAFKIAENLHLPLDIMPVRRIAVPGKEEVTLGAIADEGAQVMNDNAVRTHSVSPAAMEALLKDHQQKLQEESRLYRNNRPACDLKEQAVIVVSDGMDTGTTLRAALSAIKRQKPARVTVAVPVASLAAHAVVSKMVDVMICLSVPKIFHGIGEAYLDFDPVGDREITELLETLENRDLPGCRRLIKLQQKR